MRWEDARCILLDIDVTSNSAMILKDLPKPSKPAEDLLKDVNMFFEYRTEMDATVRVIKVLLTVCKDIYASTSQKVRICCQPTFQHHSTFTDFLICMNEAGMSDHRLAVCRMVSVSMYLC